ncbi:hypothetical protein Tco_1554598, partial [Tanacetum coccineum]
SELIVSLRKVTGGTCVDGGVVDDCEEYYWGETLDIKARGSTLHHGHCHLNVSHVVDELGKPDIVFMNRFSFLMEVFKVIV